MLKIQTWEYVIASFKFSKKLRCVQLYSPIGSSSVGFDKEYTYLQTIFGCLWVKMVFAQKRFVLFLKRVSSNSEWFFAYTGSVVNPFDQFGGQSLQVVV